MYANPDNSNKKDKYFSNSTIILLPHRTHTHTQTHTIAPSNNRRPLLIKLTNNFSHLNTHANLKPRVGMIDSRKPRKKKSPECVNLRFSIDPHSLGAASTLSMSIVEWHREGRKNIKAPSEKPRDVSTKFKMTRWRAFFLSLLAASPRGCLKAITLIEV